MTKDRKILLVVLGVVVLLCSCCCCGFSVMFMSAAGSTLSDVNDGTAVARQSNSFEACTDAGLLRADPCGAADVSCMYHSGAFLGACFETVHGDPAVFCQDTPDPLAPGGTAAQAAFCQAHGREVTPGCAAVYGAKAALCEPWQGRRAAPAPAPVTAPAPAPDPAPAP